MSWRWSRPATTVSFLFYEYALTTGERYRNVEYITIRNGQLVETQVFFGGRV
jgi:hypothetical protein